MDLSDDDLERIADDLGVDVASLQSDDVKDCAESVKRDNPDLTESQAFAICQDMANEGQLAEAPDAHVTLASVEDPGRIERVEADDGSVRYRNLKLIGTGVWGDAGSGQHFLYSPDTIETLAESIEGTTVNLFHERENEVTDVGELDAESVYVGEGDDGLYGDIVLHMGNAASEFADEALQNALETEGREGLQGPSLEIAGDEYAFNADEGVHELVDGRIIGLALVGLGVSPGPGSADAAFAEQTRERAVALASNDGAAVLTPNEHAMDINELRERLEDEDITLAEEADDDDLRELAAALDIELQADDDDDDDSDDDDDMDGGDDDDDDDDDGDTDVDIDLESVAGRVEDLREQVQSNAERIEALADVTDTLQQEDIDLADLADSVSTLSESVDSFAEADRVDELAATVTELSETVEAIADQPEEPTSLASMGAAEPTDADDGTEFVELGSPSIDRTY